LTSSKKRHRVPRCNIRWRKGPFIHADWRIWQRTGHSPKLLIVAPMSGHYATLLRGTVEALLPTHEVYITDWTDARMVPLAEGPFDLDDYIDYVIRCCMRSAGRACDRRLPAVRAGAGRGRAHGSRERSAVALRR
jgi:polyhydroxyalkanoate depolymerase